MHQGDRCREVAALVMLLRTRGLALLALALALAAAGAFGEIVSPLSTNLAWSNAGSWAPLAPCGDDDSLIPSAQTVTIVVDTRSSFSSIEFGFDTDMEFAEGAKSEM